MAEEKTPAKPAAGSGDDNLFGALAYIIAVLLPLFILFSDKKSNKFLVFHAWQSLLFSVAWVVIWIVFTVITVIGGIISGGLGFILSCVSLLLLLVMLVLALFLAYRAYKGERYKLPVIGDIAEKQVK